MPQLVGVNCVICRERISNELNARFCRTCGHPRHDGCARAPEMPADTLCGECGATVDPNNKSPEPKVPRPPAPAPSVPQGPFPIAKVCPKCASANFKKVRPVAWVAFVWDRVCRECGTRFTPPTPEWAALVFLGAGALLAGVMFFSIFLRLNSGNVLGIPAMACEGFLGVMGCLAFVYGIRTLSRSHKG